MKFIDYLNKLDSFKKDNFNEILTAILTVKAGCIKKNNKKEKKVRSKVATAIYIADIPHKINDDKILLKADIASSDVSEYNVEFLSQEHLNNICNNKHYFSWDWFIVEDKYLTLFGKKELNRNISSILMPSKEIGTSGNVNAIMSILHRISKGVVRIKKDKNDYIIFDIGKRSMPLCDLEENFYAILSALKNDGIVLLNKLDSVIISFTMTPSIKFPLKELSI